MLSTNVPKDVVKSRVQLRSTPPAGNPVKYIGGEIRAIIAESGLCVPSFALTNTDIPTSNFQLGAVQGTYSIMYVAHFLALIPEG